MYVKTTAASNSATSSGINLSIARCVSPSISLLDRACRVSRREIGFYISRRSRAQTLFRLSPIQRETRAAYTPLNSANTIYWTFCQIYVTFSWRLIRRARTNLHKRTCEPRSMTCTQHSYARKYNARLAFIDFLWVTSSIIAIYINFSIKKHFFFKYLHYVTFNLHINYQ